MAELFLAHAGGGFFRLPGFLRLRNLNSWQDIGEQPVRGDDNLLKSMALYLLIQISAVQVTRLNAATLIVQALF